MKAAKPVLAVLLSVWSASLANVITIENMNAGTSDWIITNPSPNSMGGRSTQIEGYCSEMSVAPGETFSVHVSTGPASQYRADIYRLGYYGGTGGRLVASFGPLQGTDQPDPVEPYDNLYECRWPAAFEVTVGNDWVSGVYVGKLTELRNGYESYVIFVVRDDRAADLMLKVSDFNWQAYNAWGGGSLYEGGSSGNYSFDYEVSFDRPYGNCSNMYPMSTSRAAYGLGTGEFLAFEWPMVYVLEERGYDVTYISCLDAHLDAPGLLRTKGLICAGHDEYWSQAMYDNVQAAVNAGVGLAVFSGNAVFCAVDIMPSRTTTQPDRTMERSYLFSNPKELMGVDAPTVYEGANCYGDFVCTAPDHWVYEGTGMSQGDRVHDLIGWEVHKAPYKDVPSLRVWSRAGVTWGEYAATSYEAPLGNTVVSASTIWWASHMGPAPGHVNYGSYDAATDGPFPADERVNRMTTNIFDRIIATSPITTGTVGEQARGRSLACSPLTGSASRATDMRGRTVAAGQGALPARGLYIHQLGGVRWRMLH